MKKKINWKVLIFSLVFVYIFAFLGSIFTKTGPWYESVKPSITPPSYIFPIVWNILFFLIALSLYFILVARKKENSWNVPVSLFLLNLFLNTSWSFLFFALEKPIFAFYDLILIWVSILSLMIYSWKIGKKASSLLLVPYLLWVSFAGILNYLIAFG